MTKKIAIVSRKGGTGKTTVTWNLAAFLAGKGKQVLVMDLDPMHDLTEMLFSKDSDEYKCLVDGFMDMNLNECVYESNIENVDIIPGNRDTRLIEEKIRKDDLGILKFTELFDKFDSAKYDYILVDTPPSESAMLTSVIKTMDSFIHVSDYLGINSLSETIKAITYMKEHLNPAIDMGYILFNAVEPNTKLDEVFAEVRQLFSKDRLLSTRIPRTIKLKEIPVERESILTYAPESDGAKAYNELGEELLSKWERK